jgi:hypothetical protein
LRGNQFLDTTLHFFGGTLWHFPQADGVPFFVHANKQYPAAAPGIISNRSHCLLLLLFVVAIDVLDDIVLLGTGWFG